MMKNLDKPAYPQASEYRTSEYANMPDSMIESSECLTKREYACIHLGIPESGDPELDEIIRKSERKRIAEKALQGILSHSDCGKIYAAARAVEIAEETIYRMNM